MLGESSVRRRCGSCGLALQAAGDGTCPRCAFFSESEDVRRPAEWVPVHACADEWTALSLEAEIRGHGISCWRRCLGIPGYVGLLGVSSAHWGWVLVDREDVARAKEIIRNVLVAARVTRVGKDDFR